MKLKKLAYWTGLSQADGWMKRNKSSFLIEIESIDFILIKRFQTISKEIFNSKSSIFKRNKKDVWSCKIGITKLIPMFEKNKIYFSDPPMPPKIFCENDKLFGSYLAGIIDGDGDVRIKRPKYPQCTIRISSGKFPKDLSISIKERLKCSTLITKRSRVSKIGNRKIYGTWYELEFYISSKNAEFIKKYVLPNLILERKSNKIRNFLTIREF
ncbi:MAG: hypothetical protein JSV92_02500 [archaeon]|nr:MAG: hypothetical protein JSV92_02500 [archaeon]